MTSMKLILINCFIVISSLSFAQTDSITNYKIIFSRKSILSNQDNYTINNFITYPNYRDTFFTRYINYNILCGRDFSYDVNKSMRGITPLDAVFILTTNYLIQAIDKKFFYKPYVKKSNPLLKR